jgi:hypothetical protein
MSGSPDGRAYLIGHGCTQRAPGWSCDWDHGDSAYLARTIAPPSPSTISDAASWEFFTGRGGASNWSASLADAVPLFEWLPHGAGIVTMTHNAALGVYITIVTTRSAKSDKVYDAYVLESAAVMGPFALVDYLYSFGEQGYFLNAVSKFWAPREWSGDTTVGILAYSADYTFDTIISPRAGRYGLVTTEMRLEPIP